MKKLMCMVMAICVTGALAALAEEGAVKKSEGKQHVKKAGGEAQEAVQLQEMTLTGKVEKKAREAEEGKAAKSDYILVTQDGDVKLPSPKKSKEGAAPAILLDDFVGKSVTVVGKGTVKQADGKKLVHLRQILEIRESGATPKVD